MSSSASAELAPARLAGPQQTRCASFGHRSPSVRSALPTLSPRFRARPAGSLRRQRRPAQRLGRLRQRRRSRRVRRLPRPPEPPVSDRTTDDSKTSRRPPAWPTRSRRARRRGATSTATATSISTSALPAASPTSCIATTATDAISPTWRRRSASVSSAFRGRRRGSTTTTTAISISSSRSAISRTGCFATTAAASPTSPSSRASAIRGRPSAPSGSTSTATAISICSSPTRTATRTACFATTAAASSTSPGNGASTRRGASEEFGGVGAAVADFDGDGFLDLFVANYGPSALYRNDGGRRFVDVTKETGLFFDQHATTPSWGDYDNDGRPDLYVAGFLVTVTHYPDHLFHNAAQAGGRDFADVLPALVQRSRCQPRRAVGGLRQRRRARPRADEQRCDRRALPVQEPAAAVGRASVRLPSTSSTSAAVTRRRAPRCGSTPQERGA